MGISPSSNTTHWEEPKDHQAQGLTIYPFSVQALQRSNTGEITQNMHYNPQADQIYMTETFPELLTIPERKQYSKWPQQTYHSPNKPLKTVRFTFPAQIKFLRLVIKMHMLFSHCLAKLEVQTKTLKISLNKLFFLVLIWHRFWIKT